MVAEAVLIPVVEQREAQRKGVLKECYGFGLSPFPLSPSLLRVRTIKRQRRVTLYADGPSFRPVGRSGGVR